MTYSVFEVLKREFCSASPAVCTSGTGLRTQVLLVAGTALLFQPCNANTSLLHLVE